MRGFFDATDSLTHSSTSSSVYIQKKRKKNHLIKKLSKNINPRERTTQQQKPRKRQKVSILCYTPRCTVASICFCFFLFWSPFARVTDTFKPLDQHTLSTRKFPRRERGKFRCTERFFNASHRCESEEKKNT